MTDANHRDRIFSTGKRYAERESLRVSLHLNLPTYWVIDTMAALTEIRNLVERFELPSPTQIKVFRHSKTTVQRQIAGTDVQIDTLVYELYGLSADEKKTVEDAITRTI